MAQVVLEDPENGGLDAMVAGLIISTDVRKIMLLEVMRGTVTIAVPDAEVAVGLRFSDGVCHIHASAIPGSMVRIEMPSETLMAFSTIPLMFGMPSVLAPEGRAFVRQLLTRKVRISGLRHLRLIAQLNTLLSLT